MIRAVRRHSLLVLAVCTVLAVAGGVASYVADVPLGAVVSVGLAVAGLAGLAVLVGRQVHREAERTRADVASAVTLLQREMESSRAATATLGADLVPVVKDLARSQAAVSSEAALSKGSASGKAMDLRFIRLHSSVLTDAQAVAQLLQILAPTEPLPVVGGWAMSPSGLLWLTRHIASERPSLVVECGSGTTTLWCAMALRATGQGRLVAFEHQPEFAERTRQSLAAHGLEDWAEVVDAPLEPVETPRGPFRWYSVDPARAAGASLLLVDGPPGGTGPHARYPALPIFTPHLADRAVVVVDDMQRADEQEAVELWLEETAGLSMRGELAQDIVALDFSRV